MGESKNYVPPRVWHWEKEANGRFANMNRPTSGAREEKILPRGNHPLQLHSLGTPNGVKATILLEELLEAGRDAEYDAFIVKIGDNEQFSSGFVEINPNSKIPALVDISTNPETRVFESGAILLYLAEKFNAFIPASLPERAECFSWLMWQMGSTPYVGGGFGHFYAYAPEKLEYPINRYTMETKRLLDVLDKNLEKRQFVCGNEYNIADIANYSWYGYIVLHDAYQASEFLDVKSYKNVVRWAQEIEERPAVERGKRVNRPWGDEKTRVLERHSSADFK